jgi:hypothetical protein
MTEIPSDEDGLYEYLCKEYSNEQPADYTPPNKYNEYKIAEKLRCGCIVPKKIDWEKRRQRLIRRLEMERVRNILEASIPSDNDGVIQEQETTNEFDDVPIVDEPDDDETEIDEED